ncbi:N-acetyltransferase [Enterococcus saigonensis]|uniref:N-acetyltransferase n=1 Tax=Enterococcus saigonensis TaxID=1805431 RepID=A0A679IBI6_9ENTE|nr:GNAT family N-acetyltransferase [Enterococcus saigonensis]BCA85670.1 N-acetyltransferase [Enterococcus saigonensis]
MEIKQATHKDLTTIMEIIEDGRASLKAQGSPQWQNGYGPNKAQMTNDIVNNFCWVAVVDDKIVAVASLVEGIDPVYTAINGKWIRSDEKGYVALHRVAVAKNFAKKGIAKKFLGKLIHIAKQNGFQDIRIDTYPENFAMMKTIDALGFVYCGQVEFPIPAGLRNAYQLSLP